MLLLAHPPPRVVEARSRTELLGYLGRLTVLSREAGEPPLTDSKAPPPADSDFEDMRSCVVLVEHPTTGELIGSFPLHWCEVFGGLPVEYPAVWARGVSSLPPLAVHRRFPGEALAAFFRWLRESEWRADLVSFEGSERSPASLAAVRRYCRENHPLPTRADTPNLLGERFTAALSPIGSILITGASYLDKMHAAGLSAKKRARSFDRTRATWRSGPPGGGGAEPPPPCSARPLL